jgi:hypothetical protein
LAARDSVYSWRTLSIHILYYESLIQSDVPLGRSAVRYDKYRFWGRFCEEFGIELIEGDNLETRLMPEAWDVEAGSLLGPMERKVRALAVLKYPFCVP